MFSSSKSASRTDRLPKIAKLTQQRAVSFKVYELEQKAKLKTYCPFLSADQIKNKIKDQWHNLAQEEKKKYTKIVLKSTPVKEKHATNMSLKTSKRGRKRKKGIENILSKRTKLDICATPEHVNTQKLRDFRTKHTEHYDNDFSGSSASQDSQLAPLYDWTMKEMATYQKCSSNIERVIPEIVDNSPCQQAGILKNRNQAQQSLTKGQVSFSSPADIHHFSDNYTDSDTDGLLLKRDDNATGQHQTEAVINYDSDDEDDTAVLITRQEEDCEAENLASEETNQLQNQSKDEMDNQPETRHCETALINKNKRSSEQSILNKKMRKRKQKSTIEKETDRARESVRRKEEADTLTETDKVEDMEVDKEKCDASAEMFKSPLLDTCKVARIRKGRKGTKSGQKSAEVTTPVGLSAKLSQLATPSVPQNLSTRDKYATPQMDEILQQLTLQAASKAPQKKRLSAPTTTELEKLRVVTAGRRVTRSLIAAREALETLPPEYSQVSEEIADNRSNEKQTNEEEIACNLMDPSGDARSANRHGKAVEKENNKSDNHRIFPNKDENTKCKDDAEKKIHPGIEGPEKEFPHFIPDVSNESHCTTADKAFVNSRGHTEKEKLHFKDRTRFYHCSMDQHAEESFRSTSEGSSSGSPSSVASSTSYTMTLGLSTNPVLEKALRNLQCTGSDSPELFIEGIAKRSSPGLLSPSLSGVSELSSASSLSSQMDHDGHSENTAEEVRQEEAENIPPNHKESSANKQQNLCEMFRDLTPPDQKTKGSYKTQRLVTSTSCPREAKNFTQLFHEDDNSLFL